MIGSPTLESSEKHSLTILFVPPRITDALHRIFPGKEGEPYVYPSSDPSTCSFSASANVNMGFPLCLYRQGIPVGPYRNWGGRLYGYRVHDSDEKKKDCTDSPKKLGLPTSFNIAGSYSQYTAGIGNTQLGYQQGKGCSAGYSSSWQTPVQVPDGHYIQSLTLYNSGVNSYTEMAQNCDYDTVPTSHDGVAAHKCQCNSVFGGITIGMNNTQGEYSEEFRNVAAGPHAVMEGTYMHNAVGFSMSMTSDFMLVGYGSAYLTRAMGQYDTNTNQHGVENHKSEVCKYVQTVARGYFAPVGLMEEFDMKKRRALRGN